MDEVKIATEWYLPIKRKRKLKVVNNAGKVRETRKNMDRFRCWTCCKFDTCSKKKCKLGHGGTVGNK